MKKIQQFLLLKFSSERLRNSGYKIDITLNQARLNNEVISLADNEVLRQFRKIKGIEYFYQNTRDLINQKKKLSKEQNTKENRLAISKLQEEIDSLLFVSEIIFIQFSNVAHYRKINKNGLIINGKKFVRLLCGAGHARRSTVMFSTEEVAEKLTKIFDNGRNLEKELVAGKLTAYSGLYASSTQLVTQPRFVIIPDLEVTTNRKVDWVFENELGEDDVIEKEIPVVSNLWDGQGLVSMEFAGIWAKELELDYVPNSFCIRSSFLKGQCVQFDFHELARLKKISNITDIYGKPHKVKDIDAIITASQFKLWSSYDSMDSYLASCSRNEIKWGVSKYSPKNEKNHFWSSYQYLQVLFLNDEDVKGLCKPTLDYLKSVSMDDPISAILYLMGNREEEDIKPEFLDNVEDRVLKALLINKKVMEDNYVRNYIIKKLNKKIKESYTGKLLLNGNYQVAISDPYALAEFSLGLEVKGLLGENEHYCEYWNKKNITKVSALRSPLTWRSEVNKLNLKTNKQLEKWFGHLHSGIIYNVFGVDTMIQADSDFDYDIIATTDNKYFWDNSYGGLPITYERKNAPKKIVNEEDLFKADTLSFGSKIGLVTNFSTLMYVMISQYEQGTIEYETLLKRLKICRFLQGMQIDRSKGILTKPIPDWSKWKRIKPNMEEDEKQRLELHNKLLLDKRPLFMRYLYSHKNKEYKKYYGAWENFCQSKFGFGIDDLLSKDRNEVEQLSFERYIKFNPFVFGSDGVMDKILNYTQKEISEHKINSKNVDFDFSIYMNDEIKIESYKLKDMRSLFSEYKSFKRNLYSSDNFENGEQMLGTLRNKAEFNISNNVSELANLAITVSYETKIPSGFAFDLFFDGVVINLLKNSGGKVEVPVLGDEEKITYLGKNYKIKRFKVKNV